MLSPSDLQPNKPYGSSIGSKNTVGDVVITENVSNWITGAPPDQITKGQKYLAAGPGLIGFPNFGLTSLAHSTPPSCHPGPLSSYAPSIPSS